MKRNILLLCFLLAGAPVLSWAQGGFNSKGGTHRGAETPFTDQDRQSSSWTGSGIALDSRYFATNNHVVNGATHLFIAFSEDDKEYAAETIVVDEEKDLALVYVSDPSFPGFPPIHYGFKTENEDVGVDVFVLGYPMTQAMGDEVKLTTGVVSSRSGYKGDKSLYQVSAPIQAGNSGGPLFNDKGELIGIICSKLTGDTQNVSYAVKFRHLASLVASSGRDINLKKKSTIAAQPLSKKCKELIPCTVRVLADNKIMASRDFVYYGTPGQYPIRVNNPGVGSISEENLRINGVNLFASFTTVYFIFWNGEEDTVSFQIPSGTFLVDPKTGIQYPLSATDNCDKGVNYVNGGCYTTFALAFKPLPASCESFDIVFPGEGQWVIKGVRLSK